MKNLITKTMVAVFLTLVIPVFALAAELPPLKTNVVSSPIAAGLPQLNTNVVFRPISPDLKLKAVNNMLKSLNMPPAPTVPPAKVVLTPAMPVVNNSYLYLTGYYAPKINSIAVKFDKTQRINYVFETIPGKTYLLDISVGANSQWTIYNNASGWIPNMSDQQGHLLIPFIARLNNCHFQLQLNAPQSVYCYVGSAELTQIN